ncbi:MAG: ATP-binding protein [Campylobacteraceae bacterium]|nr:ATP-binding protein [Campylobacteraceae bacterium]
MGANASGKTTFGKLLCSILNFMYGRPYLLDKKIIYDKEKHASFTIEFAIKNSKKKISIFRLYAKFDSNYLLEETLKETTLKKTDNITKVRKRLDEQKSHYEYKKEEQDIQLKFQSYLSSATDKKVALIYKDIKRATSFWFLFSDDSSETKIENISDNLELTEEILKSIDNSIKSLEIIETKIERGGGDKNPENTLPSYKIVFRNNETVTIPKSDLRQIINQGRLSRGTLESLYVSNIISNLLVGRNGILYLDEILPHLHTELEIYLISKIIKQINRYYRFQFFYTTHNVDCLDMDLPIQTFIFFKRNEDGSISVVYPESIINKNDRKIKNYAVNNIFDTIPDFSPLDESFDKAIASANKKYQEYEMFKDLL